MLVKEKVFFLGRRGGGRLLRSGIRRLVRRRERLKWEEGFWVGCSERQDLWRRGKVGMRS